MATAKKTTAAKTPAKKATAKTAPKSTAKKLLFLVGDYVEDYEVMEAEFSRIRAALRVGGEVR